MICRECRKSVPLEPGCSVDHRFGLPCAHVNAGGLPCQSGIPVALPTGARSRGRAQRVRANLAAAGVARWEDALDLPGDDRSVGVGDALTAAVAAQIPSVDVIVRADDRPLRLGSPGSGDA